MAKEKKYYAVVKGRKPGIYTSWPDCKAQIDGFSGAVYKGFVTMDEAKNYIKSLSSAKNDLYDEYSEYEASDFLELSASTKGTMFAFVDGSFLDNVGYGSGLVMFYDGACEEDCFAGNDADYLSSRNIAGEIFAAERAIDEAIYKGASEVVIYHDYSGIEGWATGAWSASAAISKHYAEYIKEIKGLISIKFCKIAGHTGVPLNEKADELAKKSIGVI